jgi:hypothetical protein
LPIGDDSLHRAPEHERLAAAPHPISINPTSATVDTPIRSARDDEGFRRDEIEDRLPTASISATSITLADCS